MADLVTRFEFWIAMIFAMLVKLKASQRLTKTQTAMTVAVSVTGALLFTEPVYNYFGFTGDTGRYACCAIVALTCEDLARKIMGLSPQELINLWRGKAS